MAGTAYRLKHLAVVVVLGWALAAVTSVGAANAAADDIIARWFDSYRQAGAEVADYARIDSDGDTARIVEPRIAWEVAFTDKEDGEVTAYFEFSASAIDVTGLEESEEGYSLAAMRYSDDSRVLIKVSGPGDTAATDEDSVRAAKKSGKPQQDTKGTRPAQPAEPVVITRADVSLLGVEMEEVFFPKLPAIEEDPARPVSRYLPYFDMMLRTSVARSAIARMEMVQEQPGATQELVYEDIEVTDMRDGRTRFSRVGSVTQTVTGDGSTADAPDGGLRIVYEDMISRGIDLNPLRDLLTGEGDTGAYRTVTAQSSISNLTFEAENKDQRVEGAIERIASTGLRVRPAGRSLIELFDRAALGEKLEDKEAAELGFALMGAFAIDEIRMEGLKGAAAEEGTFVLAQMTLKNLSAAGLGLFQLDGLAVSTSDGQDVRFNEFAVGDVVFPELKALLEAAEADNPDPMMLMQLGPRIGRISLRDAFVDPGDEPSVSLGAFDLVQEAFIGMIPTRIAMQLQNAVVPVSMTDEAQEVLTSMGLTVLGLNAEMSLSWEETTQELTLERTSAAMNKGGAVAISARLGGVPRAVIENPTAAQQLLGTLTLIGYRMRIEDAALVTAILEQVAREEDKSVDEVRAALIADLEKEAGPLAATEFGQQLREALARFLADPQSFELRLDPINPVPVAQILGLAGAAPDQLPVVLGASVSAN